MGKRFAYLLAGIVLGMTAPTIAQDVAVYCQPALKAPQEPCEPTLNTYFKQGHVPNRCRVS